MVEHSILNPEGGLSPELSLETAGEERVYDVREWEVASIQGVFGDVATTGVVTVYRTNHPGAVAALEVPATLTPGGPMTPAVECGGFAFLVARVTTAHAGKTVRLYAAAKRAVGAS